MIVVHLSELLFICFYLVSADKNTECGIFSRENLSFMCKNTKCLESRSIADLCQFLYETHINCGTINLPFDYICDNITHCYNSIDESIDVCSHIECRKNQHKCLNRCLHYSLMCDGSFDCPDHSDEDPINCRSPNSIHCPPLDIDKFYATCHISYGDLPVLVPCDKNLSVGTEVDVNCKLKSSGKMYQSLMCLGDGRWSEELIDCEPECGTISRRDANPLIMYGTSIEAITWPWYAALFENVNSEKWKYFCSSTIISGDFVITAAHCVWYFEPHEIKVLSGKTFSDYYLQESSCQERNVSRIIKHYIYQDAMGNYGSDIALLKLSDKLTFTELVLPICLNSTLRGYVEYMEDWDATVAGMGLNENGTNSSQLKQIRVKIAQPGQCVKELRSTLRKFVTIASFCAKGPEGAVCNGDSGSGLAVKNKINGKWFLEGVLSINYRKPGELCDKNEYSVYTKVGLYGQWIEKNINI